MPKPIATTGELREALSTLCYDLGRAKDHHGLLNRLIEADKGQFQMAMSLSPVFWMLTGRAHFETTAMLLCRAYDWQEGALTLRTMLETIRDRPDLHPAPDWPPRQVNAARLVADLEWVNPKTNGAVRKLIVWRNNVFAHRDRRWATSKGGLGKVYPIPEDQVNALVDNGFEIAQRYYGLLFGMHFDTFESQLNDFERTVSPVNEKLAAQIEPLKADVAE